MFVPYVVPYPTLYHVYSLANRQRWHCERPLQVPDRAMGKSTMLLRMYLHKLGWRTCAYICAKDL